jgi:hypothetical protein
LNLFSSEFKNSKKKIEQEFLKETKIQLTEKFLLLMLIELTNNIKYLFESEEFRNNYISSLMLTRPIKNILKDNIEDIDSLGHKMLMMNLMLIIKDEFGELTFSSNEFFKLRGEKKLFEYFFKQNEVFLKKLVKEELFTTYLGVNLYEGKTYYNKERLEDFINLLVLWACLKYFQKNNKKYKSDSTLKKDIIKFSKKTFTVGKYLKRQSEKSEYLFDKFLDNINLEN